jgi:peroxiredoxin Q/BCP
MGTVILMADNVSFELQNQDGETVSSDDFQGKKYVMFFYPRAMTPGCTTESCDFRDSYSDFADAGYEIIGVSPDPPARNRQFKEKERLNFDLLSDEDHRLAESLGAWGEKKMYGKVSEGLIRSTFVVDDDGTVAEAYRNVRAKGHVDRVKADLLSDH